MGNNTNPICQCPNCTNVGVFKYGVRRRGGNNAFLCELHKISDESYFTKNNNRVGKEKAHGMTLGIEFETDYASPYARLEMMLQGFLPTHDGSIRGPEFKSPIMEGFNIVKAYTPTIDYLMQNGDLRLCYDYNDPYAPTTGTHTHIGHHTLLNELTMTYIRRFYHSLFLPLCKAMQADPEKVERVFGRNFVDYASPINERTDPENHSNFVNTQHKNTLEWRICVYRNSAQYNHCVDVVADMSAKVFNTFCWKVWEMGLTNGQILTADQKSELKKAAEKAAKQIVKVWEKA